MGFQVSPGIKITEYDLTNVVSTASSTTGAIAGIFPWGPVGKRMLIDSETLLWNTFGQPTNNNYETFFTAANFLAYGDSLLVVRAANTSTANGSVSAVNAVANTGGLNGGANSIVNSVILNDIDFQNKSFTDTNVFSIARYPGSLGNSLRISFCDSASAYSSNVTLSGAIANGASAGNSFVGVLTVPIGSNTGTVVFTASNTSTVTTGNTFAAQVMASISVGDNVLIGNTTSAAGIQYLNIASIGAPTTNSTVTAVTIGFNSPSRLAVDSVANTVQRTWEFSRLVTGAPTQSWYVGKFGGVANTVVDEVHAVVVDDNGLFTGVPGTVLEVYQHLSRATDATTYDGNNNYYQTVINYGSKYLWVVQDRSGSSSALSSAITSSTNAAPLNIPFTLGTDGYTESNVPLSVIAGGYDFFNSAEIADVSLVMQGKPIGGTNTINGKAYNNFQLANYIIDNITSRRKDCIALISPDKAITVNNSGNEALDCAAWRTNVRYGSYHVFDSGYKYQYDKYNNVYRYVPLNGDIAGLCVNTDSVADPWNSPAGFNRGQLKNIVRLAWNPRQSERDILYSNDVNAVVTFPGQGTVLYGDKTGLGTNSAFSRIGVRRLFIVIEKAIAIATQGLLFEFNDVFTQNQFKNLVVPYLRTVQGRRGINSFDVVCDATNNTPTVVDNEQFVGDIYIKPARSINGINLNFVAVGTGATFSEIEGSIY